MAVRIGAGHISLISAAGAARTAAAAMPTAKATRVKRARMMASASLQSGKHRSAGMA
jgi:hypothetical protein